MFEWPAFSRFDTPKTATTASPMAGSGSIVKSNFMTQPLRRNAATNSRTTSSNLMPAVSFPKLIRFIFGIKSKIVGQSSGRDRSAAIFLACRYTNSAMVMTRKTKAGPRSSRVSGGTSQATYGRVYIVGMSQSSKLRSVWRVSAPGSFLVATPMLAGASP